YMGGDPNILKKGNNSPIAYVYRWPVKQSSHHVDNQEEADWQVTSPYDLQQDGNGEAEFSYRYRKFVMTGYPQFALNGPIDEPIIRYAYVLLMWSEALVQLDDLANAAAKINLIRGRKSVEMPPYTFTSKEDGLEKIRNESRRELCNEGVNFYEELRWGTLRQTRYDDYMNYSPGSLSCNGIVTSGNGGVNWSATNDYSIFPVPSSEIEKNPNLTKTPGWLY
ncbi:MAG: RagB/SusD family nutrient uptake outer membrane protein, partial [Paramuribaculum sp.]|nr:RagB/SusD family nutrient uptake outer membrane protein [Paramuribaculum sp.]